MLHFMSRVSIPFSFCYRGRRPAHCRYNSRARNSTLVETKNMAATSALRADLWSSRSSDVCLYSDAGRPNRWRRC